uniref:Uncharacterized protein n=1 Tax=Anguilla anguilla TaxID=7936 RepID=A0A0E9R5V7_ANGAN
MIWPLAWWLDPLLGFSTHKMNIRLKGGNQSTWRKTTQTQDATFAQRGPSQE